MRVEEAVDYSIHMLKSVQARFPGKRVIIGEEIRGANEQWGDGSLGNGIEEGQYLEAESRPDESRVVVHGIVEYRNSCCGAERVRL